MEDYKLLDFKFPNEDIMEIDEVEAPERSAWQTYFDRVVNHFIKGIGVVLFSLDGKQLPVAIQLYFKCTKNITKYKTCMNGLLLAINMKVKKLNMYGNLALIIC